MKKSNFKQQLILILCSSIGLIFTTNLVTVNAQNNPQLKEENKLNKCSYDLELLGNRLVKDIPSYGNRIIQKSSKLSREISPIPIFIIIASKPEFKPLPLHQSQYQGGNNQDVKQIFFTTLERQYMSEDKIIETQNYHHLLLTETTQGWRIVMVFSRFGSSNPQNLPTPPKDTTNSIIGQAIKLWLRDCRAGVI
jgi:hypothetical protein